MNYRSLQDLNSAVVAGLWKLPPDIHLVAGIPRSGLLPASLIALYLDLPLTDTQGLLEGRIMLKGRRSPKELAVVLPPKGSRILIVDDSILSGTEMRRQRQMLARLAGDYRMHFLAVYGLGDRGCADQVMEIVPSLRVFEWNIMHSPLIDRACVDVDGVVCRNPTHDENDDGPRYRAFMRAAEPRWIPSREIGWLVTSRLEKYRSLTVEWLGRHAVKYRNLIMVDLPDQRTRDRLHDHARYKGLFYRSVDSPLFIESSASEAMRIAQFSGKAVWSVEDRRLYHPDSGARAAALIMEPQLTAKLGLRMMNETASRWLGRVRRFPGWVLGRSGLRG